MKGGWTYIMANKPFGVLYVGVTDDIAQRVAAHRDGRGAGFTRRFNCTRLVLVEPHATIEEAIAREKALKNWPRAWKLRLIAEQNIGWDDLWERVVA